MPIILCKIVCVANERSCSKAKKATEELIDHNQI